MNYCVVYLKLTQYYKSTILHFFYKEDFLKKDFWIEMDKFAKSLLHISSVCGYLGVYECVQVSVNMYNCVCGCLCVWVGVYRFIKYNILHIYSLFIYTQMCVYTYEYEPFYITMTSLPHSRNATF